MLDNIFKLAIKFYELTKFSGVYSKVKDLPDVVQNALKDVDYHKADIELESVESVSPKYTGSEGRQGFFMMVNLETGEARTLHGSWGGVGLGSKDNLVDLDDTKYALPPGVVAIKGSMGYPRTWATIYLHPANLAKLLPIVDKTLSPRDRWILYTFDGLTSAGRKDEWRRERDIPSEEDLNRLAAMGYLKRSRTGATKITTEGKNALNRRPGQSIFHPESRYRY